MFTKSFEAMSVAVARGKGLPDLGRVVFQGNFDSLPEEEIRQLVIDRFPEISDGLTSRRKGSALPTLGADGENELITSMLMLEDDAEAVSALLYEKGLTDGLPVVPPTEDRVRRMIDGSGRPRGDVIARVPPELLPATVESIAVNAVMAGCNQEYMPLLVAAIQALCDPDVKLDGIQVTTNPVGPLLIINGPVRVKLDINSGSNVFGPGWQANATIGRAIRLILLNIGGARPGTVDQATQGFPGKYTLCIGENEEGSPWNALHVERGFRPDQSTVTVVGVNGTVNLHDSGSDALGVLKSITHGMAVPGANNFLNPNSHPVLVLNPTHAKMLDGIGYNKERLKEHLFEHVRIPFEWLSERRKDLRLGETDEVHVDGMVPITAKPENIIIVVAGGEQGHQSTFLPSGIGKSVTRPIE